MRYRIHRQSKFEQSIPFARTPMEKTDCSIHNPVDRQRTHNLLTVRPGTGSGIIWLYRQTVINSSQSESKRTQLVISGILIGN